MFHDSLSTNACARVHLKFDANPRWRSRGRLLRGRSCRSTFGCPKTHSLVELSFDSLKTVGSAAIEQHSIDRYRRLRADWVATEQRSIDHYRRLKADWVATEQCSIARYRCLKADWAATGQCSIDRYRCS